MDTLEAIEIINGRIEFGKLEYSDVVPEYIEALEPVIKALRKQEPVKPLRKEKTLYCPNCDHWLLWDDAIPNEWDNYCGVCGQKLDWGGTK